MGLTNAMKTLLRRSNLESRCDSIKEMALP
jgi:hypothetical protein